VADPIEHVIVLTLENRSFDHILGNVQSVKPTIDGVIAVGGPRTNEYAGQSFAQTQGAQRTLVDDPIHEHPDVMIQLMSDASGQPNAGFVRDYAEAYPKLDPAERGEVMKFHALDTLPALHALARHFTVCDRWFSSVPGPTWANRLFAMSGTSLGRVKMANGIMNLNLHWYEQATVFDRLNEREKSWKVYFGDAPLSLLLVHQWEAENAVRHRPMTEFYRDALGRPEKFPAFSWVEPAYFQPGANDDHPPHDVLEGELLVASVYNALRANEPLWNTSLLVVLFDEHGGFYDHVSPPATVAPDHHQEEYTFDRLGVRVPVILASPWLPNDVLHDTFDHTSLLKYLTDKWNLGPLGERTAQAKSFAHAILSQRRTDAPVTVPTPRPSAVIRPSSPAALTDHQTALVALSHVLESMAEEDAHIVAARSRQLLSGPQSQIDAAVDRFEAFLAAPTKATESH
jgi:phospholipase C